MQGTAASSLVRAKIFFDLALILPSSIMVWNLRAIARDLGGVVGLLAYLLRALPTEPQQDRRRLLLVPLLSHPITNPHPTPLPNQPLPRIHHSSFIITRSASHQSDLIVNRYLVSAENHDFQSQTTGLHPS